MSRAPYDERNKADYREMTKRIAAALDQMERDPSIPATEKALAKLAQCSRGTLRNRAYPLERLKYIKRQRQSSSIPKPKRMTLEHRTAVEIHIEDKKKLLEQLGHSRSEMAVWVDKHMKLEGENKKLRRANELLQKAKSLLEERVRELTSTAAQLEVSLVMERAKAVVAPFQKNALDSLEQGKAAGKETKRPTS